MKRIIFSFVLGLICSQFSRAGDDSLYVELKQDTLVVWNINVWENCAFSPVFQIETADSIIKIVEKDTSSEHTTCNGYHNFRIPVANLSEKIYTIEIWRAYTIPYYPDTAEFITSLTFNLIYPEPLPPGCFFPLEVGNMWTYEVYDGQSKSIKNYIVTKDSVFPNGKKYFYINRADPTQMNYVRTDSAYVYFYNPENSEEVAAYKLNAAPEEMWEANISAFLTVYFNSSQKEVLFDDSVVVNSYGLDGLSTGGMKLSKKFGPVYSVDYGDPGDPNDPFFRSFEKVLSGCVIAGDTFGIVTNVEEIKDNIPQGFSLKQNYPNPFNPNTVIKFSVPKTSNILLIVYDILGREIKVLLNEEKIPGEYKVNFNAENFTSGVYLYQIKADNYIETKKMIYLK